MELTWHFRYMMRMNRPYLLFTLLATASLFGCSDSQTVTKGGTSCSDLVTADGTSVGIGGDGACEGLCQVTNSDFCASSPADLACDDVRPGIAIDLCGVPLKQPPTNVGSNTIVKEVTRSAEVDEFSGSGPVDLSCLLPAGYPEPADPASSELVTLEGIAKIFSNGCESNDLEIAVHKVKRTGGADDGEPGELVGTAVVTAEDCSVDGVAEEHDDCGTRYECRYSYEGVPTETELMVVTTGMFWTPIYEYNLYIGNGDVVDGKYEKDVRALQQSDYGVIATVAIGATISPGKGAIAGEVHDCGDVRLNNAVVDINVSKEITTYFTENEDDPLPDIAAKGTSALGLYSSMNVNPGPMTVAAAGVVDGKLVGLGHFHARIFPDAVTSVTFRGLRPFQVPAEN